MKSLKVIDILAGVILLLSVVLTTANNITWGKITMSDRPLATEYVVKPKQFFKTHKVEVVYPPKGHRGLANLTGIRVFDWGGRKNYGFATLKKGGPGHRNATTVFKSQKGKPMNFTVQYFGRQ